MISPFAYTDFEILADKLGNRILKDAKFFFLFEKECLQKYAMQLVIHTSVWYISYWFCPKVDKLGNISIVCCTPVAR